MVSVLYFSNKGRMDLGPVVEDWTLRLVDATWSFVPPLSILSALLLPSYQARNFLSFMFAEMEHYKRRMVENLDVRPESQMNRSIMAEEWCRN